MTIAAVLFDADGVIQRTRAGWREQLIDLIPPDADHDAFIAEVFATERPCLDGRVDFPTSLAALLDKWRSTSTLERALRVWTDIEVDAAVIAAIARLRRAGMACHLASNQQAYRARYMSKGLGYRDVFDREFYSCSIGVAKPDPAYFERILASLEIPADRVLFLDDVAANVTSAREVGVRALEFAPNGGVEALRGCLAQHGLGID